MFIVDTALKARAEQGTPIRVGILGAGFMSQGLTNRIVNTTPGMTATSFIPQEVAANGQTMAEVMDEIITDIIG
jgi:predicted homoserine dehydrogenase-like protein